MAAPILNTNIAGIAPIKVAAPPVSSGPSSGEVFHAAFTDAISRVEGFHQNAQASIDNFLSGEGEELHQVALATQKAELSFELFMQVRNKVVNAYQEVMRMQV